MNASDAFQHVTNLERPLLLLRGLLGALLMLDINGPEGRAIYAIASAAMDNVADMDIEHSLLFRLAHPDRERFERDGWPETNRNQSPG
jgi:hypothetical protein